MATPKSELLRTDSYAEAVVAVPRRSRSRGSNGSPVTIYGATDDVYAPGSEKRGFARGGTPIKALSVSFQAGIEDRSPRAPERAMSMESMPAPPVIAMSPERRVRAEESWVPSRILTRSKSLAAEWMGPGPQPPNGSNWPNEYERPVPVRARSLAPTHFTNFDIGNEPEPPFATRYSYSNFELYAAVWFGSIVGAILRVALWTAAEDGMFDVHRTLYANFIGCIIMGMLTRLKGWLVTEYYSIYLGLGVGLCGSTTSFSAWQVEASHTLIRLGSKDSSDYDHEARLVAWLSVLIVGLCVSLSAVTFGAYFVNATTSDERGYNAPKPVRRGFKRTDLFLAGAFLAVAVGSAYGFGLAGAWEKVAMVLFAPLGTTCRYQLSKRYNKGDVPYGTFVANIAGTTIAGIAFVIRDSDVSTASEHFLGGVLLGFCGCLSTVSTFMVEIKGIADASAQKVFAYVAGTIFISQAILLMINGIYVATTTTKNATNVSYSFSLTSP